MGLTSLGLAALLLLSVFVAVPARAALAAESVPMPFAGGKAVRIIQGYDGGTHQGRSRFGLDLVLDGGGTSGADVVSPVDGSVSYSSGGGNGCVAVTRTDGKYTVMMCHVIVSKGVTRGATVARGQVIGTVGAPGTVGNNGVAHIHLELHRGSGVSNPIPFAAPDGLLLEGVSLDASNRTAVTSKREPIVSSNRPGSTAAGTVLAQHTEPPATLAASAIPTSVRSVDPNGQSAQTTTAAAAGRIAMVQGTDSCLKVREKPAADASVVTCLPEGTKVSLKPQADGANADWRQTDQGWISTKYLKRTGAVVSGTDDCLNVRKTAGAKGKKVGCLKDGTAVTIVEGPKTADGSAWYRIEQADGSGTSGWVIGKYLD